MSTIKNIKIASEADDLELGVLLAEPSKPVGIVMMAHGMAEHKERYIPFMEFLCQKGYICIINDHRGHGESVKSKEDLGYFYKGGAAALIEDMHTINTYIRKKYPALPLFLFGHSMGSLAVRAYTKKYDDTIDGLVVSGSPSKNPATGIAKVLCSIIGVFKGKKHRSEFINNLAFSSYGKAFTDTTNTFRWLSTDRTNVENYEADELCGYCFTVNGFSSMFDIMKDMYSKKGWTLKNPSLPVHFVAGEHDPCIVNETEFLKAVDFMRTVGYKEVSYKLYEGMRHEILNDTCKNDVMNDLLHLFDTWRERGK